jgi:hypothetical protein
MARGQDVYCVHIAPFWYGVNIRTGFVVNVARKYGALRRKLYKGGHRVWYVRQNGGFTPYL